MENDGILDDWRDCEGHHTETKVTKKANVILNEVKDLIHASPLALAAQWCRSFGHLLEKCTIKTFPQDDARFWGFAGSLVLSEFGALRKKVDVILNEVVTVTFPEHRGVPVT